MGSPRGRGWAKAESGQVVYLTKGTPSGCAAEQAPSVGGPFKLSHPQEKAVHWCQEGWGEAQPASMVPRQALPLAADRWGALLPPAGPGWLWLRCTQLRGCAQGEAPHSCVCPRPGAVCMTLPRCT